MRFLTTAVSLVLFSSLAATPVHAVQGSSPGTRGGGHAEELGIPALLREIQQDALLGKLSPELGLSGDRIRSLLTGLQVEFGSKIRVPFFAGSWIVVGKPREYPASKSKEPGFNDSALKPNRLLIDADRFGALATPEQKKSLLLYGLIDLRDESELSSSWAFKKEVETVMVRAVEILLAQDAEWLAQFKSRAAGHGWNDHVTRRRLLEALRFSRVQPTDEPLWLNEGGKKVPKIAVFEMKKDHYSLTVNRASWGGIRNPNARLALALHEAFRVYKGYFKGLGWDIQLEDEDYPLSEDFFRRLESNPAADLQKSLNSD